LVRRKPDSAARVQPACPAHRAVIATAGQAARRPQSDRRCQHEQRDWQPGSDEGGRAYGDKTAEAGNPGNPRRDGRPRPGDQGSAGSARRSTTTVRTPPAPGGSLENTVRFVPWEGVTQSPSLPPVATTWEATTAILAGVAPLSSRNRLAPPTALLAGQASGGVRLRGNDEFMPQPGLDHPCSWLRGNSLEEGAG
jgi:hypothetical protein